MANQNNIGQSNFVSVLLRPRFAAFSLSVVFSQIATNMLNIVLILLTYQLTKSSFAVSILIMTFLLPQVFFSFMGGIIADAKNKRKILLYGNGLRVILLLMLFFAKDTLAFVYMFQLAIAVVTQFYVPAEAPLIPYIVKKQQLLAANSIFGICLFGSILVGYVLAGPSIRFFGNNGVFLFMSFLFLLAYLCILFMPKVTTKTEKLRTEITWISNVIKIIKLVNSEFRTCIGIIRSQPKVANALTFLALSQVIVLDIATLIPDYAQQTLGISQEDISLLIFAPAALGMIAASLVIGIVFSKIKYEDRMIDFGIFLSVISLFLFSSINSFGKINVVYATFVIAFLAGVSNAFIFIPAQTIIQTQVKGIYLSKIYGLLFAAIGVMAFLPIILTGAFADVVGVRINILAISGLLFIIGIFRLFFLNRNKNNGTSA